MFAEDIVQSSQGAIAQTSNIDRIDTINRSHTINRNQTLEKRKDIAAVKRQDYDVDFTEDEQKMFDY